MCVYVRVRLRFNVFCLHIDFQFFFCIVCIDVIIFRRHLWLPHPHFDKKMCTYPVHNMTILKRLSSIFRACIGCHWYELFVCVYTIKYDDFAVVFLSLLAYTHTHTNRLYIRITHRPNKWEWMRRACLFIVHAYSYWNHLFWSDSYSWGAQNAIISCELLGYKRTNRYSKINAFAIFDVG